MREQTDSNDEIAKAVKASGVLNPQYVVLDRMFFCIDARTGFSSIAETAKTSLKVSRAPSQNKKADLPWKPLEHTNSKWTKDAKDAIEWLYNHKRRSGKTYAELAAQIGIGEKWLPRYFRHNPPNVREKQVNAIWRLKAETEANP